MLAIYDAMQFVRPPVETTCVGQAASTAAVLLAGGSAGRRADPAARAGGAAPAGRRGRGTIPDLILEADEVARVRAAARGDPRPAHRADAEQVREDTDRDLVLPGQAAVDYGIADAVLTGAGAAGVSRSAGDGQAARQRAPYGAEVRGDADRELPDGQAEGAGDGRQDLRRRVLETALDLGEVLRRDPGPLGDVGQPLPAAWRSRRSSRPTSSRHSGSAG